ncbi:MAG: hypothetical protein ABF267_11190 [Glaciecola sp.]
MREKQRLRAQYGIREAQLRKTFQEAKRTSGLTNTGCAVRKAHCRIKTLGCS